MNFLPIVDRELRVAARKRSTFWLRIAAALTALVIGVACLILNAVQRGGTTGIGTMLFYALTWLCQAAGLSAGLFFTSDCLSEEKREGTLGLLFLTDLRGYDVVLGKLLATSLRGFYALLAVFPILALTLLLGGITGEQYWKSVLALVNALFLSLAAGMGVSSMSRDSQRAMSMTLLLLLLLSAGAPLADSLVAGARQRSFTPLWSLASPAYLLAAADAWGRASYWSTLLVTQLIGWSLLALASALAPRGWQDRKRARAGHTSSLAYTWRYGGTRRRARLRRKLVGRQPVAWLACRERWQSQGLWIIALLLLAGFVAALVDRMPRQYWMIWNWIGGLFTLILYLWAASQSCRFFIEARRSGLLELLLATPLNERQIIAGQWQALLRMFGLPVLLLLGVHVTGHVLSQMELQRATSQAASMTTTTVTNQTGTVTSGTVIVTNRISLSGGIARPGTAKQNAIAAATAAIAVIIAAANLLALCWFGMWMGLTSRTSNLATLKTILFVQVIPWLVITFGITISAGFLMSFLMFRNGPPSGNAWYAWWALLNALLVGGLTVAKDIGFIAWSRKRLYSSIRDLAALGISHRRLAAPRPLAAAVPAPPIIAAPR